MKELFHFFVESCSAHNDFVEFPAKDLLNGRFHLSQNAIADDGQTQENLHRRCLEFGHHHLLDDFLNNEGYANDNFWFDVCKGLNDNLWSRFACKVMYMETKEEFKDEFKCHAIHVSHREHGDDAISWFHLVSKYFSGKLIV